MRKASAFDEQTQLLLESIGGEPLNGSGFEGEISEAGFGFDSTENPEEE